MLWSGMTTAGHQRVSVMTRLKRQVMILILYLLVLAVLHLLVLLVPAKAAPRPVPRLEPVVTAEDLIGDWRVTLFASSGDCTLYRDGRWHSWWGGKHWNGKWSLKAGCLTVTEKEEGGTHGPFTWRVDLRITGGGGRYRVSGLDNRSGSRVLLRRTAKEKWKF